ncbi:ABC transporter ATP-binding protein [Halococcus sp. IIIV-5B]|uniref:ABC transporter ATP-binding protein n=1 Tax=Halococcus sp. IIIV-5B TaxID=2321230 RepID=UPI000E735E58|nr:ABC transporter ATP-binding protein [Halococcus sp. IIIV-5B]RJT07170.1 ABC transporter ATP-binding protein [Halococcus sp. IIIV-5B]
MTVERNSADVSGHAAVIEDPIIEVKEATVGFEMDRGESRVLDQVSIGIEREEILGVVGESGSGKSMFASALLDAVVSPGQLSGEIVYYPEDSDPVSLLDLSDDKLREIRWEEIAMVFQGAQSSFNPTQKIRTHFEETLDAHDANLEEGMSRATQLLSDLHLDPERILESYPHELSGGMSQRALIALSLVLEPNLLVMDEPTAALDLLMQRSILNLLQEMQETYGVAIVFITHDLPLVAGLVDRLAVMYAFDFIEVGPASKMINEPTHPYTRALLKAAPSLDTPFDEMRPIDGSSPDPVNVPSGCSYSPRCPLSDRKCEENEPPYQVVSAEHETACYYWEESIEEIDIGFDQSNKVESRIEGEQSSKPVLELEELSVHFENESGIADLFGGSETVQAVNNVDLKIHENDVVALVGESGCGKTTLGKTAIALQEPTSGTVEYRGQNVWDAFEYRGDMRISPKQIRQSLQIIHQDPGTSLNPNKKVISSLLQPLKNKNVDLSREERVEYIHQMLNHVGMAPPGDYSQRYPHQLSGGEKQRVALVRALLMNPDLILADEAVSALDVSLRVEVMDLMLELQALFDTSYLFVSHNLSNARYLAGKAGGRIAVMYLGRIVEIGPVEEVIENPQHPYTQVLKWSTTDVNTEMNVEEPPIRNIDIPDATNPPDGCRFHTRCPEAREPCKHEDPAPVGESHEVACFRSYGDDHPYWDAESLPEIEENPADS